MILYFNAWLLYHNPTHCMTVLLKYINLFSMTFWFFEIIPTYRYYCLYLCSWFLINAKSIFGAYPITEMSRWCCSRTEIKTGIIPLSLPLNWDISSSRNMIKHHHITIIEDFSVTSPTSIYSEYFFRTSAKVTSLHSGSRAGTLVTVSAKWASHPGVRYAHWDSGVGFDVQTWWDNN